ncbi:hypothetical protein SRHO_G00206750 [Serrasalmus rhombeus]
MQCAGSRTGGTDAITPCDSVWFPVGQPGLELIAQSQASEEEVEARWDALAVVSGGKCHGHLSIADPDKKLDFRPWLSFPFCPSAPFHYLHPFPVEPRRDTGTLK